MENSSRFSFNSPIWLKKIGLIILFFFCYIVLVSLISYGGELLMSKKMGIGDKELRDLVKNDSEIMLFSYIFNFIGSALVIFLFWKFILKKNFFEIGFNDPKWYQNLIMGMLCGIISIAIGFTVCVIFGFVQVNSLAFSLPDFSNYLAIFILVAFSEEMMTRGLMLSTLMEGMNKYIALIIVSFIFGALHLFNDNVTTLSFINISIAGVFLGISYIYNRSLWFPIGLHFTWNFFQGPVFGFEVSGHKNISIVAQTIHGNDSFTGGEFGFEGSVIAIPIMLLAILAINSYYLKNSEPMKIS